MKSFAMPRSRVASHLVTAVLLLWTRPTFAADPVDRVALAEQVRGELRHAWKGYATYAWGHDALRPLSRQPYDWYAESLGMTPVDALDTLILAGLDGEAREAHEWIATRLSFDKDLYVKNFEIVIRLLGGLLSGYQLTGDERLLKMADDLGTRLLPVFNSPTGMPYVEVNLKTGATRGAQTNPAEVGTLLVEFGTLSKLTGKPVYYDKAKKALVELYHRRSGIGLVADKIDVDTGRWTSTRSHLSGGIDSYYEYLLKCWLLFGDRDCERMWKEILRAVNRYLAQETSSGLWYGHVDVNTGEHIAARYGALDAFFPAVLALGGDVKRARRLQESSFKMWTLHGIEPEMLDYGTMQVVNPTYLLRPEIMESAYYLEHYTHDPLYLRMGQTFLESLRTHCRTETGYAALVDVRTKEKKDEMESFFFAETLKYLYLLFAPPATLDLDRVVFNTEAHPIQRTK